MPDGDNDLFGSEIILSKEDYYPIRTYPEFEEKSSGPDYVKRIDPLASLAEVMSSLEAGEFIGCNCLLGPLEKCGLKRAKQRWINYRARSPKTGESMLSNFVFEIDKLIPGHVEVAKEDKKTEQTQLTSGKQEAIKSG